jgi:hypothetical protein
VVRNQQVVGSIPTAGSNKISNLDEVVGDLLITGY